MTTKQTAPPVYAQEKYAPEDQFPERGGATFAPTTKGPRGASPPRPKLPKRRPVSGSWKRN